MTVDAVMGKKNQYLNEPVQVLLEKINSLKMRFSYTPDQYPTLDHDWAMSSVSSALAPVACVVRTFATASGSHLTLGDSFGSGLYVHLNGGISCCILLLRKVNREQSDASCVLSNCLWRTLLGRFCCKGDKKCLLMTLAGLVHSEQPHTEQLPSERLQSLTATDLLGRRGRIESLALARVESPALARGLSRLFPLPIRSQQYVDTVLLPHASSENLHPGGRTDSDPRHYRVLLVWYVWIDIELPGIYGLLICTT